MCSSHELCTGAGLPLWDINTGYYALILGCSGILCMDLAAWAAAVCEVVDHMEWWEQVLRDALVAGCSREWEARRTANTLASAKVCEAAEEACEAVLEHEQSGVLPSTGAHPHALFV